MNREDVIRMAREAGMAGLATTVICEFSELQRFAALVASAERNQSRAALAAIDARLRECMNIPATVEDAYDSYYQAIVADAIRALD